MTPKELADKLNGREYRKEISEKEEALAKKTGLVVVFGASDDLIEFRGAINEEAGMYDGGSLLVTKTRILTADDGHRCDCEYCGYEAAKKAARVVLECRWSHEGYSWHISTKIKHAPFDILEDGEKYCRGIVFLFSDLPG